MHRYPTLTALGIDRIDAIACCTLKGGQTRDELRIYFHAIEGSTRLHSMKFSFLRPGADGSQAAAKLLSALDELQHLTRQGQPAPTREQLLGELGQLEKVVSAKLEELRSNLQQWH